MRWQALGRANQGQSRQAPFLALGAENARAMGTLTSARRKSLRKPAMDHPILDPLRMSLCEKLALQNIGLIARICLIDRRKLLAFSDGQYPEFSAEELERLAYYLELRLATTRHSPRWSSASRAGKRHLEASCPSPTPISGPEGMDAL
jgi:hypothetical protein